MEVQSTGSSVYIAAYVMHCNPVPRPYFYIKLREWKIGPGLRRLVRSKLAYASHYQGFFLQTLSALAFSGHRYRRCLYVFCIFSFFLNYQSIQLPSF